MQSQLVSDEQVEVPRENEDEGTANTLMMVNQNKELKHKLKAAEALNQKSLTAVLRSDLRKLETRTATVLTVSGKFGNKMALKLTPKKENSSNYLEFQKAAMLQHTNIVPFMGLVFSILPADGEPDFRYLDGYLMEYMNDGSLHEMIRENSPNSYDERNIMSWIIQACHAVAYCHHKEILHRKLEPSNMLLTNNYRLLKISDLTAARSSALLMTANVGSVRYAAPEVIGAEEKPYDFKADIYSLAMVLWELYSRRHPFKEVINSFELRSILMDENGKRPDFSNDMVPCQLRPVIESCWKFNAQERPTIIEMLEQINAVATQMAVDVGNEWLVAHRPIPQLLNTIDSLKRKVYQLEKSLKRRRDQ